MQGRGRKFFVANAPKLTDLESREDPSTSAAATEQAPPPPTARSVLKRQVAALSVHLTQHGKRWQLGCGAGSLSRHGSAERSQQSVVQPGQGEKEEEDNFKSPTLWLKELLGWQRQGKNPQGGAPTAADRAKEKLRGFQRSPTE
ncbi:hypothetical protein PAMP_012811 [Pampus punctatissimus]